ncbi:aminopeptidase P family protein [Candidatus Woesearchaeota archaeon]|nr:MAG: aminopeptidase P family protein [Candidatus Woesearchaeota archaeon]
MMNKEKLKIAQQVMKDENIPFWIIYAEEGRDPTFERLIGPHVVPAVLVVSQRAHRTIVSSLDADNIEEDKMWTYSGQSRHSIESLINRALRELHFDPRERPEQTIAFNYSTMRDAKTDLLGYGVAKHVMKSIRDHFGSFKHQSAEAVIYGMYDRKSPDELKKMTIAAQRADEILKVTFRDLQPGTTEKQAYQLVHSIMNRNSAWTANCGVVKEELAWAANHCPVVLTGPNFAKGGHAGASDTQIMPGHTVYFDFGVKLTFKDGTSWCSDIQRMGYVLRGDENRAPFEVQKVFNVLVKSIDVGIAALRPGVKGYMVDEASRKIVVDAFGVNYDHATGHSLGESTHSPGTRLTGRQNPLSHLKVQPWGVYTIEPRVKIDNGGSIEEDVVVVPNGPNYTLCERQKELIYIR